jgi:hypothetical protein
MSCSGVFLVEGSDVWRENGVLIMSEELVIRVRR